MPYDTFTELEAAYNIVQEKWFQGNLIGAYNDLYEIFQYRLLHSQLTDADLKIIQSLADLAGIFGNFEAADNLLRAAINLYEQRKSEYWADYARLRLIQISIDKGDLNQAQNLLLEMSPRIGDINNIQFALPSLLQWESGCIWSDANSEKRTVLFAELYLAMGRLLASLGQYAEALISLKRGLYYAQGEDIQNIPSLALQTFFPLKLNIASALLEKGEFDRADNLLWESQIQLNQTQHPEYQIRWLELSGKLNLLQGNLGEGLKKFQQVEKLCRQLRSPRAMLRAKLNLVHILIQLNQTSAAQNYLLDTQRDALKINDSTLVSRADLLLQLCNARSNSPVSSISVTGMSKKISDEQPLTKAKLKLDLSNQSSNYLAWFEDRALAFQLLLSELKLDDASNLLEHINKVFEYTDSQVVKIRIRVLSATLVYYQGTNNNNLKQIEKAHLILSKICLKLELMGLKPELWQVQRIMIWCRTRLNYSPAAVEALTLSANQLLEQITITLPPTEQVFYLLNKWTADEEYIASQINQLSRLKLRLNRVNLFQRLWLRFQLIRRLNFLVEYIDKYKDALAKRTTKPERTIDKILPSKSFWLRFIAHPKDRITLMFLILPDRILIIKTGLFLFDFNVIPTTRIKVRNCVKQWYDCIQGFDGYRDIGVGNNLNYNQKMIAVSQVGQDVTENLADMLDLPKILQQLPKRIRALTVIPDDILHGFPFAAITYKNKYLIQTYAVSIAYELKSKSIKPLSSPRKQALVVGVSKQIQQFQALPGVNRELEQVVQWLKNNNIYFQLLANNSATKTAIVEKLSQANLLHIACHGTFEPNQPDKSGLVLISDSGQKDILSLRQLSEIDLRGLRHATLSSCWSADHFILPGRWIISLPETLWRSGTQSILGCLWEVSDKVAVSFMSKFYHYLEKFPRDRALRRTQLDCLNNQLPNCDGLDTSNPFFWAGFCLYGDYTFLNVGNKYKF
ncbi:CHAT domain-containing protein [Calothrix sp. CCY 0018]|uniref:CHAT domain-containing tetratricopeptide repeat protein n=1 Tax=Calothrix sp. CCY 0018 TaxID=3103864 RepID=UPI0039C66EE3